jgi:hypothetical protein
LFTFERNGDAKERYLQLLEKEIVRQGRDQIRDDPYMAVLQIQDHVPCPSTSPPATELLATVELRALSLNPPQPQQRGGAYVITYVSLWFHFGFTL